MKRLIHVMMIFTLMLGLISCEQKEESSAIKKGSAGGGDSVLTLSGSGS